MKRIFMAFLALVPLIVVSSLHAYSMSPTTNASPGILVASVPIGEDGLGVDSIGSSTAQDFYIDDQGTIYIADTFNSCIILVKDGGIKEQIQLPKNVRPSSISLCGDNLYILDNLYSLSDPKPIYVVSGGKILDSFLIPVNHDNAIQANPTLGVYETIYRQIDRIQHIGDRLLLTYDNGSQYFLIDGRLEKYSPFQLLVTNPEQILPFGASYAQKSSRLNTRSVEYSFVMPIYGVAALSSANQLTQCSVMGFDSDGRVYIQGLDALDWGQAFPVVFSVMSTESIYTYEFPQQKGLNIGNAVSVDSHGNVYFARIVGDKYEIIRQTGAMRNGSCDIGSDTQGERDVTTSSVGILNEPTIWREDIWSRALSFINASWQYNSVTNSSGPDGILRGTLPTWISQLTGTHTLQGLPYNWGGCMSVSQFISYISQGYQAGNVAATVYSGVAGVDCTGYIWQAYGYTAHQGTISSSGKFSSINWADVQWMDVCSYPGVHAVLFNYKDAGNPNKFYTLEATTDISGGKVGQYSRTYPSYSPYRHAGQIMRARVASPNGGEVLIPGSSVQIQWSFPPSAGNVRVEFSANGGASWSTLFSSTANDGAETWTVPATATTQGRIRVTSISNGSITDTSDANFSIANITVSSPNGGERWRAGSVQSITWSSVAVSGNVRIDLFNGSSWLTIISNTANDGIESWIVAPYYTSNAKIRVVSLVNPSLSDESNGFFEIYQNESK